MLRNLRSKINKKDPLMIQPYYGYASPNSLWIKGRVLENEGIFEGETEGAIRNLIQNFKRFETDEVPGVKVNIEIKGREYEVVTDREGYFTLDVEWDYQHNYKSNWIQAIVTSHGIESAVAEVFFAAKDAQYGIITDIDDTVLKTNVTSIFKLKMLYATFFKDAHQRLPMEGIVELFSKFADDQHPIFYISHSPWNIFDTLSEFMDLQGLPKGPILLRDYGLNPVGNFHDHKLVSIKRVLDNHPNLKFIMLGDTAAEDADFYTELAHEYEGQIAAIYIRQTRRNKNAKRVEKLVEEHSDHETEVILTDSSSVMLEHAKANGYIS
ncbi:App1 family protein [Portibacter marinus]|uniref:App1 family protein n=1 Tax=Portibacter marinus TaxID=2898660 RepID=UPI001F223E41|nr:phosphatase domain-containing protein [Portibacter marinus]